MGEQCYVTEVERMLLLASGTPWEGLTQLHPFAAATSALCHGLGLSCWECNSAFDPRCGETKFDSSTLDTVDCNQLQRNHLTGLEPIYCRKIIQRIEEEVRTVRGCGWVEEKKIKPGECYTRTGTKDIMVTYCHCDHDDCNPGNVAVASLGLSALLLALTRVF